MRNTKRPFLFAFLLTCAFCGPSFGQQRVFNWLPANDERVRLDPANYHTGRTYHPSANGGNIHVDIKADVAAIRTRVIRPPGMIVGRIQPHALIIGGEPIENSLLAKRRPAERAGQQKSEKERPFGVSHGNPIGTRWRFTCKVSTARCPLAVS